jgi:phenylpyruvate tautomerase PptA (4-oxalocrotonate tautomerase family)
MSQVKIFGLRSSLSPVMREVLDVIHSCVVDALQYPVDKRAHRFFPLEREEFFYPPGRTDHYTIIEISMFEGRSVEAKKALIRLLFERFAAVLGIGPQDVEVTIFETPMHNWGFRGLPGDEHALNYKLKV